MPLTLEQQELVAAEWKKTRHHRFGACQLFSKYCFRLRSVGFTDEEVHSLGAEALCKAAASYDATRGVSFPTWVGHKALGVLREELRRRRLDAVRLARDPVDHRGASGDLAADVAFAQKQLGSRDREAVSRFLSSWPRGLLYDLQYKNSFKRTTDHLFPKLRKLLHGYA